MHPSRTKPRKLAAKRSQGGSARYVQNDVPSPCLIPGWPVMTVLSSAPQVFQTTGAPRNMAQDRSEPGWSARSRSLGSVFSQRPVELSMIIPTLGRACKRRWSDGA
jgi:hypothetical protein